MKYSFVLLIALTIAFSCKKKEDIKPINSMKDDLQTGIKSKNVQALQICHVGLTCSQTIGWGTDYSFDGDNIIRVRDKYYNLNKIEYYKIETITIGSETETRMVLYFP